MNINGGHAFRCGLHCFIASGGGQTGVTQAKVYLVATSSWATVYGNYFNLILNRYPLPTPSKIDIIHTLLSIYFGRSSSRSEWGRWKQGEGGQIIHLFHLANPR